MDKQAFFAAAPALKRKELPMPEGIDGSIWVRELTALEAAEFKSLSTAAIDVDSKQIVSGENLLSVSIYVVTAGAQDDEGAPLFNAADAPQLKALPSPVLEHMADAILDLSGLAPGQKKAMTQKRERGSKKTT